MPERDLATATRRHSPDGFARRPPDVIDRLTGHFVRVVPGVGVMWVHPSWRDLVIDELAHDAGARRAFLHACCSHGAVLALSSSGGAAGTRMLPLLVTDGDWDALCDRLVQLVQELDAPEVALLLGSLQDARRAAAGSTRREVEALADTLLRLLAQTWGHAAAPIPVGLLGAWLELAAALPEPPAPPELTGTWIELVPLDPVDLSSAPDVAAFEDWTAFAELLSRYVPDALAGFRFPAAHAQTVRAFVTAVSRAPLERIANRDAVIRSLRRLHGLAPDAAGDAWAVADGLAAVQEPSELPEVELRELSPEALAILDLPLTGRDDGERVVARVLRDL